MRPSSLTRLLLPVVALALVVGGSADAGGASAEPAINVAIQPGNAFVDGMSNALGLDPDRLVFPPGDLSAPQVVKADGSGNNYGYDFTPDGTGLYAINTATGLNSVSQSTGDDTVIAPESPPVGENWMDLSIDPVTGAAYIASADNDSYSLFTVDLATGAKTLVNTVSTVAFPTDLAIDCSGQMYAEAIGDDKLYRVDRSTAALTVVGPLGFDIDFNQGMDFDNATGLLHAWLLGSGGNAYQYSHLDTSTGAATAFPGIQVKGEFEGAIRTTCSSPQVQIVSNTVRTRDLRPGFAVAAANATTAECSFDQGTPSYTPCLAKTGPGPLLLGTAQPATTLTAGQWTLRVRATYRGVLTTIQTRTFTVVDCLTLEYTVQDAKKALRQAKRQLKKAKHGGTHRAVAKAKKKVRRATTSLAAAQQQLAAEPVCA